MTRHAMTKLSFGCLALLALGAGQPARAQSSCAPGQPSLVIYHAGSLSAAFSAVEKLFTQQTGTCVTDVAAGSLDAARRVSVGAEPADIFAAADYLDIKLFLQPAGLADYTIAFAEGGMVLAYSVDSRNADTIAGLNGAFRPPGAVPNAAADWYSAHSQQPCHEPPLRITARQAPENIRSAYLLGRPGLPEITVLSSFCHTHPSRIRQNSPSSDPRFAL